MSFRSMLASSFVLLLVSGDALAGAKKDVTLVVWDATRPDHLSAYGYARPTTPNLDKIAAKSTVFLNAQASGSWTIPSAAAMFTGLFSHSHLVDFAPAKQLVDIPLEATTLAETLGSQGYYTALLTSQNVFYQDGYTQGFAHHEVVGTGAFKDKVLEIYQKAGDKPVFLVMWFLNPHSPYEPPEQHDLWSDKTMQVDIVVKPEDKKDPGDYTHDEVNGGRVVLSEAQWTQLRARYDGELRSNDQRLQNTLDRMAGVRNFDDSVFILTADHGEMFNERPQQRTWHGWPTHENQRVPLLIKAPGQTARTEVKTQVRGVDLFPTILELAGVSTTQRVNGESLVPLMRGQAGKDRVNVGASHYWDGLLYYNDGSYNFITSRQGAKKTFVYDLKADPEETTNLAETKPELVERLRSQAEAFMASTRIDTGAKATQEMSAEDADRLRALGYME